MNVIIELDCYTVKEKHYGQLHLLQLIIHNRAHFLQKYLCYPHNFDLIMRASQKSKRFYNWIIGTLTLYMIINFLYDIWLNIYLIGINFSHL